MAWKLLLSARDPGAAAGIAILTRAARRDRRFEAVVVAAPPADGALRAANLPVEVIDAPVVSGPSDPAVRDLTGKASTLIDRIRPDAIIVGLSGGGGGLDEALLAEAGQTPTFALQDFWGDANMTLGRAADIYLVIDQDAAALTRARTGALARVVGSVKHSFQRDHDFARARARARDRLDLTPDQPLMGWFGQPARLIPGYRETLEDLLADLSRDGRPLSLTYRPHPKESPAERADTMALLARHGIQPLTAPATIEDSVAACDLVASVCSTSGVDALMAGRASPVPLSTAVFALFRAETAAWFRASTGLDEMPLARAGAAVGLDTTENLAETLHREARLSARAARWQVLQAAIPDPAGAAERALDAIDATLAEMHRSPRPIEGNSVA